MDPELAITYSELMREAEEALQEARAASGANGGRAMEKAIIEAERLTKIASRPRLTTGGPYELEAAVFEARQVAELTKGATSLAQVLLGRLSKARAAAERAKDLIAEALKPHVGDEVRTVAQITWEDAQEVSWIAPQGVKGRIAWIAPDGEVQIRLEHPIVAQSTTPAPGTTVAQIQKVETFFAAPEHIEVVRRTPSTSVAAEGR